MWKKIKRKLADLIRSASFTEVGVALDYSANWQTRGVGGEIQLTDAIRRMLAEKSVYGYRYPGRRHDIGNPQGYLRALEAFAD